MIAKVNVSGHAGPGLTIDVKPDLLITPLLKLILEWIIFTVVCQAIDIFGIVTNVMNIICFVKQGFKDPVNVSLLALAVSDLGCLVTLVWTNICLTPAFRESDLPFDALEFQYLTSAWPHATFTRVTSWITALITLERCLCITSPLKVKQFVTPKRVAIITVCVYLILIASVAPVYVINRLELKFFPGRNKTLIGLAYTKDRENVEKITFAINNFLVPFSAFITVSICTSILIVQLQENTKWRRRSALLADKDNVSQRNQKVAKMVVMISIIFITCFTPVSVMFLAMSFEPDLSIDGIYRSMLTILLGIGITLESINSSTNIFIYYHMSSNYRSVFRRLFCTKFFCKQQGKRHISLAPSLSLNNHTSVGQVI